MSLDSNPPGSTITTSKDVHGRLFLCLKSSKYGAFSATSVRECPAGSMSFGIPNGIPSLQVLIFGIPKSLVEYQCALKLLAFLNSRSKPPSL